MEFVNESKAEGRLFIGALNQRANSALVLARSAFRLGPRADMIEPADEEWPIFAEPLKTEYGVFPSDDYPLRSKAEIIVVASVRSRRAVRYLQPQLQVGKFADRLLVFGNRRWIKQQGDLVPSEPEPFVEMQMGLNLAYGGSADYGGEVLPHPLNPAGKGFYLSADVAAGGPLPNIERSEALIRRWNDQPPIATWGVVPDGMVWQMAAWIQSRNKKTPQTSPAGVEDIQAQTTRELQEQGLKMFPTAAPPELLIEALHPGDPVALDLGEERIQFRVPTRQFSVSVKKGRQALIKNLTPTALWVFVPKRLVVVTWRTRFKYDLRAGEKRVTVLRST